jgi:hypothetical protein
VVYIPRDKNIQLCSLYTDSLQFKRVFDFDGAQSMGFCYSDLCYLLLVLTVSPIRCCYNAIDSIFVQRSCHSLRSAVSPTLV